MHPELYEAGLRTLKTLRERENETSVPSGWNSVFTAVQLIFNRITPMHTDTGTRPPWYDILVTVGPYQSATCTLSGTGVEIDYVPGTMLAICGRLIPHGVGEFQGERLCYAYFMKESVVRWAGVRAPHWMEHRWYQACWGDLYKSPTVYSEVRAAQGMHSRRGSEGPKLREGEGFKTRDIQ